MKSMHHILLLLAVLCSFSPCVSAETKTETFMLTFSESDYNISTDSGGLMHITAPSLEISYLESVGPALPMLAHNFAVTGNYVYKSSTATVSKRLIKSGVNMATNPLHVPSDSQSAPTQAVSLGTKQPVALTYPASSCQYVTTSSYDEVSLLHFLTCPFIYDAKLKNLYFIDSISLTVTLESTGTTAKKVNSFEDFKISRPIPEYVKVLAENPRVIDDIYDRMIVTREPTQIDYVVITCDSLKSAFEPLINWKKTRGCTLKWLL